MELGTEECALGMGQRRSYVVAKDAQTLLRKEEYAIVIGIGQRANDAAVKDVHITCRGEECVRDMGQRSNDDVALKDDAQMTL